MKGKYKIVFEIVLILTIMPLPVVADLGDIVASFNTPPGTINNNIIDLRWDGEYLWCYGEKMYKMDTNGNIIHSSGYPSMFFDKIHYPFTHDGKYYYMFKANDTFLELYKFDKNCNIITSSKYEVEKNDEYDEYVIEKNIDPLSITYDGKYIWGIYNTAYKESNININTKLCKFDANCNYITSFDTVTARGGGGLYPIRMTWDGKYLWRTEPRENRIYKLDTNGNVVTSIDIPGKGILKRFAGLTCDGKYLWCVATSDEHGDKIYKIDLGKAAQQSKPSEEEPTQPLKQPEKETPGFETLFAIAGLLVVTYLLRRRK